MDKDLQNKKYMMTSEWHPCVFDIHATLENIPINISEPSPDEISDLLERTFPLSKRAYFTLIIATPAGQDDAIVYDKLDMAVEMGQDNMIVAESYKSNATVPILETLGLVEDLSFLTQQREDMMGLVESIDAMETALAFLQDTNTDFSVDTLSGASIVGTGTAAYVKLTTASANLTDTPTAQSQGSEGLAWATPANAVDGNGSTYAITNDSTSSSSQKCPAVIRLQAEVYRGTVLETPQIVMITSMRKVMQTPAHGLNI